MRLVPGPARPPGRNRFEGKHPGEWNVALISVCVCTCALFFIKNVEDKSLFLKANARDVGFEAACHRFHCSGPFAGPSALSGGFIHSASKGHHAGAERTQLMWWATSVPSSTFLPTPLEKPCLQRINPHQQ